MSRHPITYEDFVIPITADSEGHIVLRVSDSPVGETETVTLTSKSRLGRLLEDRDAVLASPDGLLEETDAERLGGQLYDGLFSGPIHRRFLEAIGRLGAEGTHGLRIKLQMDFANPTATALQRLPWELLYRAETGRFLALHGRLAIVRHLSLPTPNERSPATGRSKLLVVTANPSDRLPLASAEECRKISAPWQRRDSLDIHYLTAATLEALRERLRVETYQGLHFIGHGEFDASTGEGRLVFEDANGRAAPCRAKDLAVQLAGCTELRWVVLNACSSGRTSFRQPFGGLATALLQAGIPALLAMQQAVSDDAAVLFSQSFYQRLAAGDGVESATSEGRLAVRRALPQTAEWAAPVLFLRSADGHVIPSPQDAAPEPSRHLPRKLLLLMVGLCLLVLPVLIWKSQSGTAPSPLPETTSHQIAAPVEGVPTSTTAPSSMERHRPVELREGEVIEIPALGIHLAVTFDDSFGTPFARLTATHVASGQAEHHVFMGPDHLTLKSGGGLSIQHIHWNTRSVSLIPTE